MYHRIVLLLTCLLAVGSAQTPLTQTAAQELDGMLAQSETSSALACRIELRSPSLNFAFRFDSAYIIRCPIKIFGGEENMVRVLLRVTPQGGSPVALGRSYPVPAALPSTKATTFRKLSTELSLTGGFSTGEGRYRVEIVVHDRQNRSLQKHWNSNAVRSHSRSSVESSLPPSAIEPLSVPQWRENPNHAKEGFRLTVLLNATPANLRSLNLHAWDYTLLLDTLWSVLTYVPNTSVRLVAFNLDQQREIFRTDRLRRRGWFQLQRALHELELGTVPYSVVQHPKGWADLLTEIVEQEVGAADPADAVVFLGPATRFYSKISSRNLPLAKSPKPAFFDLEYYSYARRGAEFPDAVEHLTRGLHGNAFKMHSPEEFGEALHSLVRKLSTAAENQKEAR